MRFAGAALVALLTLLAGAPAAMAEPAAPTPRAAPVVYIGVGDLRWTDVDKATTPTLWRLVGTSGVASMSVRSARDVSCPLDAWLSVASGSKALAAPPLGRRSELNPGQLAGDVPITCPRMPRLDTGADGARVRRWDRLRALQAMTSGSYAEPGTIGDALAADRVCATAIGRGAAVALARSDGSLSEYTARWSPLAQSRCPVTVVDGGSLPETGAERLAALRRVDRLVADVVAAADRGSYVLVGGISDRSKAPARPGVAISHRVGRDDPTWSTSDSTRRRGIVQVTDVGPTLLVFSGVPSGALDGRPWTSDVERSLSIADTVENRADLAQISRVIPEEGPAFGAWIAAVPVAVMAASGTALLARRRGAHWAHRPIFVRLGIAAALFGAAIMPSLYLVTVAQWWRSDHPTITLATVTVALAAVVAFASARAPIDRVWRFVGVQAALTYAVLTVDGLVGTPLQVGSLLGAGPVYGGRFFGFGNVTFVVYATSAMLLAAVVAQELTDRGRLRAAVTTAGSIAGLATLVDGWPTFGADFGGILSLVPGSVLLVLLVAGVHMTVLRLVGVGAAGVVAVTAVSYLDYLRPADERTHMGSFVARLLDGRADDVLANKLDALGASLSGPVGWLEVAAFLAGCAVVLWPGRMRMDAVSALFDEWPMLRNALLALALTCAIGTFVNDSGALIAGLAVIATVPLMIATCAWAGLRAGR